MNTKIRTEIAIGIILLIAIIIGGIFWLNGKQNLSIAPQPQVSTQGNGLPIPFESPAPCANKYKTCPDGKTMVPYGGPNCDVAICPGDTDTSKVTTSAVEGWQTYRNEKYGFEIRYPKDYQEQKSDSDKVLFNAKKEDVGNYYFTVSYINNYDFNRNMERLKGIGINGISGFKYTYREGAGASGVALIKSGENAIQVTIDCIGGQLSESSIEQLLNQILSTFKFID